MGDEKTEKVFHPPSRMAGGRNISPCFDMDFVFGNYIFQILIVRWEGMEYLQKVKTFHCPSFAPSKLILIE